MAKFSAHTHLILAGDSHKVLTSLFITRAAQGGNMVIAARLYYASTAVNPSNTHSVLKQAHLSRKLVFSCFQWIWYPLAEPCHTKKLRFMIWFALFSLCFSLVNKFDLCLCSCWSAIHGRIHFSLRSCCLPTYLCGFYSFKHGFYLSETDAAHTILAGKNITVWTHQPGLMMWYLPSTDRSTTVEPRRLWSPIGPPSTTTASFGQSSLNSFRSKTQQD